MTAKVASALSLQTGRTTAVRLGEKLSSKAEAAQETSATSNSESTSKSASKTGSEFEAMVLQSFIEQMLPKHAEKAYGKGTAGNVWKSFLAEHMARKVAAAGGIGIAGLVAKSPALTGSATPQATPAVDASSGTATTSAAGFATSVKREDGV